MNKIFGIDVGATTIKVVAITKENSKYILTSAGMIAAPSKGMLSESLTDQEQIAQSIRKLVDLTKINTDSVNVALPENQVYTKVIDMPVLSDKELSSAIYWEAEQYIPVPLSNITLDWQVLKRPAHAKEQSTMEVLLVGAPVSLIEKYKRVLSLAGFTINAIEIELISIIRALVVGDAFPNSLIVHIGAVSTSLAIIKDQTLVFTYSIASGGIAISRAIASDFGFTLDQAEEYKRVYGLSKDALNGKINQAASPIMMSIITEVKKTLTYYAEKYKSDLPVQQIILSGGTAKMPSLDTFFAQNTEIETVIANPLKLFQNQQIPKEIVDNALSYSIAVGLALRDI